MKWQFSSIGALFLAAARLLLWFSSRESSEAVHISLAHHSFHRGVDIKIGKLSRDVPVEERAEIGIRVRGGDRYMGIVLTNVVQKKDSNGAFSLLEATLVPGNENVDYFDIHTDFNPLRFRMRSATQEDAETSSGLSRRQIP